MKERVITAILLIAVSIPILLYGKWPFYIVITIIGLIGLSEIIKLKERDNKLPIAIKLITYGSLVSLILTNINSNYSDFMLDYRNATIIIFLLTIPIIFYKKTKYNIADALFLIGSIFFLGISFNYFIAVRNTGLDTLVFLLLITIFTDTFAYFFGYFIGKHKMSPNISPKKTWEGFFGGLLFGTFISTCFYVTSFSYDGSILILILVVASLSIIGQMGDLVFSAIKRYYGLKDFSNLLKGHGGILDRVDSILFVLLAFSIISSYL